MGLYGAARGLGEHGLGLRGQGMKGTYRLLVVGLLLVSPGCALLQDGVHRVGYQVHASIQERRERQRNHQWAEEAWYA